MANRDLLKEAIADAKSVKEAAIANAKAALEEAFTPYLKEKFTAKLAEMEAEDMDEAKEEMDENYSKEEMEEMSNPVMRKGLKGDDTEEKRTEKMREEETMDEMDLDELLAELDEELSKKEDMDETLNEQEEAEEEESEEVEGEEEEEIDLEDMTEEELKDLIEDVIEDMVRAGELEAGDNFEGEEEDEEEDIDIDMEDEEEMVAERAYYGKNKGDKPRKSTAKEKDELLKEETREGVYGNFQEWKNSFKEGTKFEQENNYMVAKSPDGEELGKWNPIMGQGMHSDDFQYKSLEEKKKEEDMMDEGLLDKIKDIYNDKELLAKLITVDGKKMSIKDLLQLAASGAKGGMAKSGAGKGPFQTEGTEEMDEMKKEIEELASTLAETKLLNAKLLYTNKIFRAKNLNETQKVKVLEAFDKASSVKEAKLIYETLTTVKETKAAVNESVRGMASKAAGIAPEKKPILEVNDQFARWQILAGIKK